LRVLLAEDNIINQKVMIGALKTGGHQVSVVSNGKEALAALDKQQIDLVLMDLQMPEMDGFQATRAIREREKATGHHLPIIALTAHAMKGDRERCLAAGMDDYLSKPIRIQELREVLGKLVPLSAEPPEKTSLKPTADQETLDRAALLARVGGDVGLLAEILQLFPSECAKLMAEIQASVTQRDAKRLQRAVHTLKGTLGILSAAHASEAAWRLEDLCRKGDLERVEDAFRLVQEQVERVKRTVAGVYSDLTAESGNCHDRWNRPAS